MEDKNSSLTSVVQRSSFGNDVTQRMRTMSLGERWKEHVRLKRQSGDNAACPKIFLRGLLLFQFPTQMYVFMVYIIPYCLGGYDEWTQYYFKVFCWFVGINGLVNWLCVILYDPSIPKTRDRQSINVAERWTTPPDKFAPLCETGFKNGYLKNDVAEEEGLPWSFCEKCNIDSPPRTKHCNYCKTCILKRDHHCFVVGNCIGFKNQRYFVVLSFYAIIVGWIGAMFTYKYLKEVYWVNEADDWKDLVPPFAIYRCIFGNTKLRNSLLVVHIYLEVIFGTFGCVYFTFQMIMCILGKTSYELTWQIPMKNTNSVSKNMQSVFGDYWALNFIFPMTIIFKQHGDAFHWEGIKFYQNANTNRYRSLSRV